MAVALVFAAAPAAQATIRFADPNGADMTSNCTSSDPSDPTDPACTLQRAVEVVAQDGDEVIVNPGDYNEGTDQVTIADAISVRGADGQPMPTISSDALGAGVFVGNLASSLRRLRIEYTTPNVGLLVRGTVEQVVVDATDAACELQDGAVIRDSVCWTHGTTNERALGMSMLSPTTVSATVRNVTAVGTGTGVAAIGASGLSGGNVTIDARNVIARGTLADVTAFASGAASTATVNLSNSNYATELETPVNGGVPSVTNPGSPTNQTASPMFADTTNGDFHQLPGSPTIDAGNASASMLGTLDIDGEPRIMGPAPDIGADELPDTSPPDTAITKRPRSRTTKKRATFRFTSTEPGSTFECKLDRRPYKPCASPRRYTRLKPGRHLFRVRATDPASNPDTTPASYRWRIRRR